jgi:hypothetical protein
MQVFWDLCHYGLPEGLDIWSDCFVTRFRDFAQAAAEVAKTETNGPLCFCPVNEMSFWSWAGGEAGQMNPFVQGRGLALKKQLARAAIAAVQAIRSVDAQARILFAEPLIHVTSATEPEAAEAFRLSQYEAYDLISGRLCPEFGGREEYLDIIGANFYPHSQWYFGGSTIPMGHHAYRPFREMLEELQQRYRRPTIVAETGAEGLARPYWFHYVAGEVRAAINKGVPVQGLCLYPILDYPGWTNDRLCQVGLFSSADAKGRRTICEALAIELLHQQATFERLHRGFQRSGRALVHTPGGL